MLEDKNLIYTPIKGPGSVTYISGMIRFDNLFIQIKRDINRYLNDLYSGFIYLYRQYPPKDYNRFCFSSLYVFVGGEIKKNTRTDKINIDGVACRFSDHRATTKIDLEPLKLAIIKRWEDINDYYSIGYKKEITLLDIDVTNILKNNDKKFLDFNVDKITRKTKNFKCKSTGENINKYIDKTFHEITSYKKLTPEEKEEYAIWQLSDDKIKEITNKVIEILTESSPRLSDLSKCDIYIPFTACYVFD